MLFDYGLTLVAIERPVVAIEQAQVAVARCIAAAGHAAPSPATLRDAVHDRVEAAVAAHQSAGTLEEIDVAEVERRAFADIGLDLDEDLRDRCSRIVQEAWFAGVRPFPEAPAALGALRGAGLRLGICSNAPYRPASMREQLRRNGVAGLVDAVVFSAEVGWRKPSSRIFDAALDALGSAAAETVFVGDQPREDVAGAQAAGMRAVLLRRDADDAGDHHDVQPDAVVRSLSELPTLLTQPACDAARGA